MDHTALVMLGLGLLFATLQYPDQMKKLAKWLVFLVLLTVGVVLSIASDSDTLEANEMQVYEQATNVEDFGSANKWVDKHIDDLREPARYVLASNAIDILTKSGIPIGSPLFIRSLDAVMGYEPSP